MPAGITADPLVLKFFVEIAFVNVVINKVAKSRHGKPLWTF